MDGEQLRDFWEGLCEFDVPNLGESAEDFCMGFLEGAEAVWDAVQEQL